MIELFDLNKAYGEQVLFQGASFSVFRGEKIGLVGRNGHGKSTLLKMIVGEEEMDGGRRIVSKDYKIGYLRQMADFTEDTVLDETARGLPGKEKDDIWKVEKILTGLGFTEEDFSKPPEIFSGGYQMRMELAKVLVSRPDMLLLDEPTNFLDIISIRWLESFLEKWKGEFVIISHDRNFMDSVVTHVAGIHRAKIRKMEGITGQYYFTLEKEEEIHEKRRINEDKKRKQIEEYISSFRAKARRAKSVQSSIKRLDKMGKMEKLSDIKGLSFSFNCAAFRPPVAMKISGLSFSYDGAVPYLIDGLDLTVERGDKICIAGANGKGKTTLAKILAGKIKPLKGRIKINPQVSMAFYEQGNTAELEDNNSVEEEIYSVDSGKSRTRIRTICGNMMFSGDNALKKISVLSGGERSRVLLARTLLFPSNLLILDEPTHHLDMESCSALMNAVSEYEGAAIVVTHDECFLRKIANKLIIFSDNGITVFPGNYSEFLEQVGWDKSDTDAGSRTKNPGQQKPLSKKEKRRRRAANRALLKRKLSGFESKIGQLEKKIENAENEHNVLTAKLVESSEQQDAENIAFISKSLKEKKEEIDRLYAGLDAALSAFEQAKKDI
jgi:ATP-binding cassette subfamily F protein 3